MDEASLDLLAAILATPEDGRRRRLERLPPPLLVDLVLLAVRGWERGTEPPGPPDDAGGHVDGLGHRLGRRSDDG